MRLSGDQAGLPGLLSMCVGAPFPWALASTVHPAYSEKRAEELEENGNLEDGR